MMVEIQHMAHISPKLKSISRLELLIVFFANISRRWQVQEEGGDGR